jgi:tripartite-type tricarboxylate transporter receptor subunit TctC
MIYWSSYPVVERDLHGENLMTSPARIWLGHSLKQALGACLMAAPLAGMLGPQSAQAQSESWPARPVNLVVTVAPGTVADLVARTLGPKLSERLRQPVVVENRVGASGMLGADTVAKSAPNGYTLLLMVNSFTMLPSLYKKVPYDTVNDFASISLIAASGYAFVVNPAVMDVKDLTEFVATTKANPGKYTYGTPGKGTGHHLAMELFGQRMNLSLLHVPHSNMGAAITNIAGGHVHMMFAPTASVLPLAGKGTLRIVAMTGKQRSPIAPAVPTYSELGMGFMDDVDGYWGVMAPAKTPGEIITRLNRDIVASMTMEDVKQKLASQDVVAITSSPEQMAARIRGDVARWGKVVADAKIASE